jgi:inosine-uridine nucleoside N-ribohydrolase
VSPIPVFVDTDLTLGTPRAEIDDGAALIMLLRSPEVEVIGISTVFGNATVDLTYANTLRLLNALDQSNIQVSRGAAKPLLADPEWEIFLSSWYGQYGDTPSWSLPPEIPNASDHITQAVQAAPGKVSILALGPLTNLAQAYRQEPGIAGLIRQVVLMGGSINDREPSAEFNIRCDPEAAQIVLSAGWPIRILGLQITRQALFSRAFFANLPDTHPALRSLKKGAEEWIPVVEAQGWEQGGCSLHDAVAAAALIDSNLCSYAKGTASIETNGATRGVISFTRSTESQPPHAQVQYVEIADDIDVEKCMKFIKSRLNF